MQRMQLERARRAAPPAPPGRYGSAGSPQKGAARHVAAAMLALGLAVSGCSGDEKPGATPTPSLTEAEVRATWLWTAAFDEQLDMKVLTAVADRWLSSQDEGRTWAPPGTRPKLQGPVGEVLTARTLSEDAQALTHLRQLYLHGTCRLAQAADAFGEEVRVGYEVGARACDALGDADGAALVRKNLAAVGGLPEDSGLSWPPQGDPPMATLLSPVAQVDVPVLGETLHYDFLLPEQFDSAIARLEGEAKAARSTAKGGDALALRFVEQAGTSRWGAAGSTPGLRDAATLLGSVDPGPGRIASLESEVENLIVRWRTSLEKQTPPNGEPLDLGTVGLLDGWFRRALYRDLGLAALDQGDPALGLLALEEAAGARSRLRPGPAKDPLLLAGIARARYEGNELQRAVDLLNDMAQAPGWSVSSVIAQTIARIAVLPTKAEAKVNR